MSNNGIVMLTHYDLDGVGCNIILSKIYNIDKVIKTGYGKLDEIIFSDDLKSYNACFVTDISLSEQHIDCLVDEYGDRLMYIDHHKTSLPVFDYIKGRNQKSLVEYSDTFSASGILFRKFNKSLKPDIVNDLSSFISCIDSYDMWRHKTHQKQFIIGHKLNVLFWHYKYNSFFDRFKNGDINFNDYEVDVLNDYYNNRHSVMKKTESINFGDNSILYIGVENNYINEYSLENPGYNFYYMLYQNDIGLRLSIRTDLDNVDIGKVLKSIESDDKVISAGGHPQAGGIEFKSHVDFNSCIDVIESIDSSLSLSLVPF